MIADLDPSTDAKFLDTQAEIGVTKHIGGLEATNELFELCHLEANVEFRTADVAALPFETDRFDVAFAESVLIFVGDKPRAIRECVRVTQEAVRRAPRGVPASGIWASCGHEVGAESPVESVT